MNANPVRPISQEVLDTASVNSGRSGAFPPGFDLSEFSTYARSNDPVSGIYTYTFPIRLNNPFFSSLRTLVFFGTLMYMHRRRIVGKDLRRYFILTFCFYLGLLQEEVVVSLPWIS